MTIDMLTTTVINGSIQYPNGYPYILFVNELPAEPYFFLAPSVDAARNRAINREHPVSFVAISDLVSAFGRDDSNRFLRKFGNNWINSNGRIFFRKDNYENTSPSVK